MAQNPLNKDSISENQALSTDSDEALASASEWNEWLFSKEKNALEVYTIKPEQLVADQRREQGISRDYKGREILELLQNAADAAKKAGVRGRIHIELNLSGLIVANTGTGFTTGGVKSLQTADLSPKRSKNSQLIGSKGLGFRAVLNWSRHPVIISGALQLAFSGRYAQRLIEQLKQKYPMVRQALDKHQSVSEFAVPILPFPVDLSIVEQLNYLDDLTIFNRCQELRSEGYETIIGMPFDRAHGYANALDQLNQLRPEFLLFSEAIESLSVSVVSESADESREKQWRSELDSEGVFNLSELDLVDRSETSQRWQLFDQTDEIPAELLRDGEDPDHYHLLVAVLQEGLAEPGNLYSFFPTSIPLPLQLLCHASLELEQNRKHLQEGEANDFVLQLLALFVADIVERQAETSDDPYRALDLLNPAALLRGYQAGINAFSVALIDALMTRNILPVLSGGCLSASQVLSFPRNVTALDWLPPNIFPNIALPRNESEKRFFDRLGVKKLEAGRFITAIQSSPNLSLEQRAAIVLGVVEQKLPVEYCYTGLLLDTDGNILKEGDRIFQPGGSIRNGVYFPDWANIKILNADLWQRLRTKKLRDSVQMLSEFGVREYSLANMVQAVIASANRAIDGIDENTVRKELLRVLYSLYEQFESDEDRPILTKANVYVLNKSGDWQPASNLYFSQGYSNHGKIVDRLYEKLPEKLLSDRLNVVDFDIDDNNLVGFFQWLGVVTWPREIELKRGIEKAFLDFSKPRLKYPAVFVYGSESHIFEAPEGLPANCSFSAVKSLDEIDTILSSDSDSILVWLASDPRSMMWPRNSEKYGSLSFWPHRAQFPREYQGSLPSYIHWKIKYTPWLATNPEGKQTPADCMVNNASVSGLFPRPIGPDKGVMDDLGLEPFMLKHAWLNAGVKEGIEDLVSEEIYSLLIELPHRDPSGSLAKKLYNWMIKTVDFELDESGCNYKDFSESGSIYARQGDKEGYFPVTDAYHVDIEGFPQELLRTLPIASLLKKRGADKVRRLFKVNVLDKDAVNERVIDYRAAACTEIANQHFQLAKKYIEIYRHSHFAKAPVLSLFKQIQLVVCDWLQSEITFNQATLENTLPPWTYSIQEGRLYVCCNPMNAGDPFNPLLANTIGDAVASILSLNDGDPFSKIYQCDEASRAELLSKMLGDDLDDDLDAELRRLIEEAVTQDIAKPVVTMGAVLEPTAGSLMNSSKPKVFGANEVGGTASAPGRPAWNVPGSLAVEPLEHKAQKPGQRVGIRVGRTGTSGGSGKSEVSGYATHKSDGKAGEELARLFEESQGRFPLYIGHITGRETIAADILSFRSDEDREKFKTGEDQDAALVERVIEAKEKWSGGSVKLTVNEVNTAGDWKGKYFIYRFTPIDTAASEYELKTLCNPLAQLEAVVSSVEISLDSARSSQAFRVKGLKVD